MDISANETILTYVGDSSSRKKTKTKWYLPQKNINQLYVYKYKWTKSAWDIL